MPQLKPQIVTKQVPDLALNVGRMKKVFKKNKRNVNSNQFSLKYPHNATTLVVRLIQS